MQKPLPQPMPNVYVQIHCDHPGYPDLRWHGLLVNRRHHGCQHTTGHEALGMLSYCRRMPSARTTSLRALSGESVANGIIATAGDGESISWRAGAIATQTAQPLIQAKCFKRYVPLGSVRCFKVRMKADKHESAAFSGQFSARANTSHTIEF